MFKTKFKKISNRFIILVTGINAINVITVHYLFGFLKNLFLNLYLNLFLAHLCYFFLFHFVS